MTEVAGYLVFALLTVASIGWYVYGLFRKPPMTAPLPPEQISALRQERDTLLKEDQIYGEKHSLVFAVACFIAFNFVYDQLPKNPPGAKQISDERLMWIVILVVVSGVIYNLGVNAINQRVKDAVKAALGDDARPSMPDRKRRKRLKEINEQLNLAGAQSPQSDNRS